jgi:hypothetical protein
MAGLEEGLQVALLDVCDVLIPFFLFSPFFFLSYVSNVFFHLSLFFPPLRQLGWLVVSFILGKKNRKDTLRKVGKSYIHQGS